MSGLPPPPHHPAATEVPATGTTAGTGATTGTTGSKLDGVGGDIGERAKGFFSSIHGAGEAIRGTINSGLDGLGDGIAGRKSGEVQSHSGTGPSAGVAQDGLAEAKAGFNSLVGGAKGSAK